jgi:hypothetical protein
MSNPKVKGMEVEMGTGNVYADLGFADADEMLIKAQLVSKIAEIIKRKGLTQTQAAQLLGDASAQAFQRAEWSVPRRFRAPIDGLSGQAWTRCTDRRQSDATVAERRPAVDRLRLSAGRRVARLVP